MFMAAEFIYDPPYLQRRRVADVDALGVGLLVLGLASLQTVLSEGQNKDWFESAFVVAFTLIAIISLALFVVWELRGAKHPAVDLSILKNSSFTSGTLIGGVLGFALFGSLFLLPLFMQELLRYDAYQSGIAMLPRSLVMMLAMPIAGRIYNGVGPRFMIGAGLALSALSTFQLGRLNAQTSFVGLILPQMWQGIAFSLIFVSLSTASLAHVARARMTNATALYNLIRQLGGSFGIAIIATLLEKRQLINAASLTNHLSMYNQAFVIRFQAITNGLMGQGISRDLAQRKALAMLNGMVQQQAAVLAFDYVLYVVGALFILALPLIFFLRPRRDAVPTGHV
jgi:DHA2 family multidrug resistance protein